MCLGTQWGRTCVFRSLVAIALFLVIPSIANEHAPITEPVAASCPAHLVAMVDQELQSALLDANTNKKVRERLKNKFDEVRDAITKAVLEKCPDISRCSVETLQSTVSFAVDKAVADLHKPGVNWTSVGIYTGALGLYTGLLLGARYVLGTDMAFAVSTFAGLVTGQLINALGAPVMNWINGRVVRWSAKHSPRKFRQSGKNDAYEGIYEKTQAALTGNGQVGRSNLRNDLGFAKSTFIACANISLLHPDKGRDICAAALAQLIVDIYHTYPEVDLEEEPLFADWCHVWYTNHFISEENFDHFYQQVWRLSVQLDKEAKNSATLQEKYRRVLHSWLVPTTHAPEKKAS